MIRTKLGILPELLHYGIDGAYPLFGYVLRIDGLADRGGDPVVIVEKRLDVPSFAAQLVLGLGGSPREQPLGGRSRATRRSLLSA